MHKTVLLAAALLLALAPVQVRAQNFDTSGTTNLRGPYLFRYVNFFNDSQGDLTESCSLTGVMTFDGQGSYTLSNTQLYDSLGTNGGGSCSSIGGGNYGVQSNGIAQLDNPLYPATLFGSFSKPVLTASSTEDDYFDLFIAVQAPSAPFTNSSLSGSFTVGTMDFPNASVSSVSLAKEGWFTLTADGKGNIAAFSVTGATAGAGSVSEDVSASTYTLSGTTGGILNFPGSASSSTEVIAGSRTLFVSADGNYLLAGSTTGSDMIFGFRAPSGTVSGSSFNGTYFLAGMDANLSGNCEPGVTNCLDAFYGSINTNGNGNLIWHQRFDDIVDVLTWDATFNNPVPTGSNPPYDGTYYYLASANGQAMMFLGSGTQFTFNVGMLAPAVTPTSSVWINPVGIINAANFTPITNAYTPGEIVSLYGSFGVSSQSDKVLPVPTQLGGVKVLVNGNEAPILFVSSGQINAIIPFEIAGDYFATFQVEVNGAQSNSVTVYADASAPGLFTLAESGIGGAALLHANGNVVTDNDPAVAGETVELFMTGLGTVTPPVSDGAAGPSQPLSYSDEFNNGEVFVNLDDGTDFPQANILFAGLAPGFAGLYQVNFTLPRGGLLNGDDYIALGTNEAENEMATIAVSGFSNVLSARSGRRRPEGLRGRRSSVCVSRGDTCPKSHRRALPERTIK
ncbi:MAG TPA: hypothetical protein VMB25_13400 [Bryobacteraceae bacterium]|nr:hypothetical protein [Bryobacteraceae bacterium]